MAHNIEHVGRAEIRVFRDLFLGKRDVKSTLFEVRNQKPPSTEESGDSLIGLMFVRRNRPCPACVKVVRESKWDDLQPGVQVLMENGKWVIDPFLLQPKDLKNRHVYSFDVAELWLHALLKIVEKQYKTLFDSFPHEDQALKWASIVKEFEDRKRRHIQDGPQEFCKDLDVAEEWTVLAAWDEWNLAGLNWPQREEAMGKLGWPVELRQLQRIAERHRLKPISPRAGIGGRPKKTVSVVSTASMQK